MSPHRHAPPKPDNAPSAAASAPTAPEPPARSAPALPALRSASLAELQADFKARGFPAFRARQVYEWIQVHCARSVDEMTNVPAALRTHLSTAWRWGGIEGVAAERRGADGTTKFLFRLADGHTIESVLMFMDDHYTLCVSSQVGCAMKCAFCVTGILGIKRNLEASEIVDQIAYARRHLKLQGVELPLRNLVFMGMGEPLLNIDNLIVALERITDPEGLAFSPRRVTVSTVGIVPGIEKLGNSELGVCLALSLNASSERQRLELMPITRKYSLMQVIEACRKFPVPKRKNVTFEYVLLAGVNDSDADARRIVTLLRGLYCKINLIPFNEHPSLPYKRPSRHRIEAFQRVLMDNDFTATVRYSKGPDIEAACGQLYAGNQLRVTA